MAFSKKTMLKEIQKRLPDGIVIEDETNFDFTNDEFVVMLCWIKYFRDHYDNFGKKMRPKVMFPVISTRLRFDFGLYHIPNDLRESVNYGKNVVYISGNTEKNIKKIINFWQL